MYMERETNSVVKLTRESSFTLHSIMHMVGRWKVCYFTVPNTKVLGHMDVSRNVVLECSNSKPWLKACINPFLDVARIIPGMKFSSCSVTSYKCPLEIGSASAERAGRGRWVGAPKGCRPWLSLSSALEMPWLALGGSLLSPYARTG